MGLIIYYAGYFSVTGLLVAATTTSIEKPFWQNADFYATVFTVIIAIITGGGPVIWQARKRLAKLFTSVNELKKELEQTRKENLKLKEEVTQKGEELNVLKEQVKMLLGLVEQANLNYTNLTNQLANERLARKEQELECEQKIFDLKTQITQLRSA